MGITVKNESMVQQRYYMVWSDLQQKFAAITEDFCEPVNLTEKMGKRGYHQLANQFLTRKEAEDLAEYFNEWHVSEDYVWTENDLDNELATEWRVVEATLAIDI